MTHLQEHWEGVSLAGDYTLEPWLGGDESVAFFQASVPPEGQRAIVKLLPERDGDGAAPLDLWQRTRQLRHSNLVELLDCGRADHGGEIALYAVFEAHDDTLASALDRAPLDPQESREVLDSLLDALRYLHAQGLVLGALDPERIVAVGERVKLSTDALREADTTAAYREDVRLFGELWQQALMPASAQSAEIAAHAADPNPETRWTLAEIGAALDPPPAIVPEPEPPVAVTPLLPEPVSVAPPEPPASVSPATVRTNPTVLPTPYRRTIEPEDSRPFPKWVFVAAAALVLLILGLNRSGPSTSANPSAVAPVSLPASPPPAAPAPKVTTPAPAPPPTVKAVAPTSKEMWRVIAFTYRTHEAAAKKVKQLNEYHPGIHANVFSPKGSYYLVSLGGRMTHEDAVRLQRTARGKGLPRDLYVQNYSR